MVFTNNLYCNQIKKDVIVSEENEFKLDYPSCLGVSSVPCSPFRHPIVDRGSSKFHRTPRLRL